MHIRSFEEMVAWQKAKELTELLLRVFAQSHCYSLKNQIERASLSIMNNIAEGFERSSDKEMKYFLSVAKGSCGEVRSMLYVAQSSGEIHPTDFTTAHGLTMEISKMLAVFMRYLADRH